MRHRLGIIPDIDRLDDSLKLSWEYNTFFEYNDFFYPAIYQSEGETRRRINIYKSLDRDMSRDTMHGVFFDIAMTSTDEIIRNRSRVLMNNSMEIAANLGVKGVVFHTGINPGLWNRSYLDGWLDTAATWLDKLAKEYSHIEIYIENTFDKEPGVLTSLIDLLSHRKNVKLCLDYGHALLTDTEDEEWVRQMAPYVGHVHLNDHDMKEDLHLAPGKGLVDFERFEDLMEEYEVDAQVLLELNGAQEQLEALKYMTKLEEGRE
ncbi:MAG: sugar phosphate isomerase/epimerase family protein [Lachnospiraceae bacterium]|nr:sugar phosphate isomerase/epimerase [Lachnospiraceae bacterium]MDY4999475.1 sugar phosphate isomerase/epimerase family protein [Lachnospiraceae bacterium]